MRRGAALPLVLFALAVSSALAVSGAYLSRQLATSAAVSQRGDDVETAAEQLLAHAFAHWDTLARASQPVGSVAALGVTEIPPRMTLSASVTRLNERGYLLVAEARLSHKPLLHNRIGIVLRLVNGLPQPIPLRSWIEIP